MRIVDANCENNLFLYNRRKTSKTESTISISRYSHQLRLAVTCANDMTVDDYYSFYFMSAFIRFALHTPCAICLILPNSKEIDRFQFICCLTMMSITCLCFIQDKVNISVSMAIRLNRCEKLMR